jgi:hypothetical protein
MVTQEQLAQAMLELKASQEKNRHQNERNTRKLKKNLVQC